MSEYLDHKDIFIKENYQNMTTRKIAEKLNVSNSTVIYRAKKMSLKKSLVGTEPFIRKSFEILVETEYEDYSITSLGRLVNTKENYVLKSKINNGYEAYTIQKNYKKHYIKKHRLLGKAFIPQKNKNRNIINHRDGVKTNNHIMNLEWCTIAENNTHAHQNNLIKYKTKITDEQALKIIELLNMGHSKKEVNNICDFTTKSITEKIYAKERWKKYLHLMKWSL